MDLTERDALLETERKGRWKVSALIEKGKCPTLQKKLPYLHRMKFPFPNRGRIKSMQWK